MPTLETLSTSPQTHRLILFGAPGSGKTASIGKLATTHHIIYFSLENGHQTLLNPEFVPIEARKNIDIIQMFDTPETPIACTALDAFFKDRKGVFCDAHGRNNCPICARSKAPTYTVDLESLTPHDIIVIDSLTQWQESISFYLTKDSPDSKGDFEYYRKLGLYLGRALSRIQLIKSCSIIVISHEASTEPITGSEKIGPAGGTKNFARNNARYFDGAYHLYKENKRHRMASSSLYSTIIDTKDRSAFDAGKFRSPANALLALFNPAMETEILTGESGAKK